MGERLLPYPSTPLPQHFRLCGLSTLASALECLSSILQRETESRREPLVSLMAPFVFSRCSICCHQTLRSLTHPQQLPWTEPPSRS